jgi:hypothetical protein
MISIAYCSDKIYFVNGSLQFVKILLHLVT